MWFKKCLNPPVAQAEANKQRVFQPFPEGHNLITWRQHPVLSNQLAGAFREELFRHVLSVLYNSIPSGYPARGNTLNDTMANIELGRVQGYMDCLNLLQSLSITPTTTEPPEQNYGANDDTTADD